MSKTGVNMFVEESSNEANVVSPKGVQQEVYVSGVGDRNLNGSVREEKGLNVTGDITVQETDDLGEIEIILTDEMKSNLEKDNLDAELMTLLKRIRKDVNDAVALMSEGATVLRDIDLFLEDLDHILELEEIDEEQQTDVFKLRKQSRERRRKLKGLSIMNGKVGSVFKMFLSNITQVIEDYEQYQSKSNQFYGIRSTRMVLMFEELTGRKLSDDSKYADRSHVYRAMKSPISLETIQKTRILTDEEREEKLVEELFTKEKVEQMEKAEKDKVIERQIRNTLLIGNKNSKAKSIKGKSKRKRRR